MSSLGCPVVAAVSAASGCQQPRLRSAPARDAHSLWELSDREITKSE